MDLHRTKEARVAQRHHRHQSLENQRRSCFAKGKTHHGEERTKEAGCCGSCLVHYSGNVMASTTWQAQSTLWSNRIDTIWIEGGEAIVTGGERVDLPDEPRNTRMGWPFQTAPERPPEPPRRLGSDGRLCVQPTVRRQHRDSFTGRPGTLARWKARAV